MHGFENGTERPGREDHMTKHLQRGLALAALLFALTLLAVKPAAADDDDPPTRVARLSYTSGEVSFSPSGTDDWVAAVVNRPITTGDKLWTDQNSRAELHIGTAAIRLSGTTGFSFLNLDDHIMQIRLTEGSISLRVRRLGDSESIEVDTPNLAFNVLRPGRYRINVNEAGDTTVINVPDGEGEVTGGGSAYTVHPGEEGIFTGTDQLNPDIESAPQDDDFDRWCSERDLREEHSAARRYVSDDVIGYQDLDDYGGWRPVPDYGSVWFPHVSVVGWAPYRFGHWVWISPWGWTWVDDAPWGFAPFHYGRWVNYGGAWGWVPCPPPVVAVAYVRPVYAPALVAWVGGPHFAAGIAFGAGVGVGVNVGWFPLGPREVFVPSYPVSRTYVSNVNISNTTVNQTVINNYYNTTVVNKNVTVNNVAYMNQNVHGAVTATTAQNFTSAQPVGRNLVQVNEHEVATAPVAVRAPSVVPPKQAVLGAGAATRVQPPAALQSRAVVAKTAPPPAPVPFAQRQEAIKANQGQPISMAQSRQLAAGQPRANIAPVRVAPPAKMVTTPPPVNHNVQSQPNANRPANVNTNPNPPANNNRPANTTGNPNVNTNANQRMDRPPSSRPAQVGDPQVEQKHQEQIQQLQQKQDQEYQKLQQKQYQQQQKLQQQNVNGQKQQQIQQQQQQQLQQMEDKHNQQQEQLQQKQQQEHTHSQSGNKPPKNEDKPPKTESHH
jgi:hypothetical protein